MPSITGIPGSSITLSGSSVAISGTTVNATAGKVQVTSATGIMLDGATIEAPGYVKVFGDSADPVNQNAPGGSVTLAAQSGDIALGNAVLSVGGSGDAGTLTLSAVNGKVDFGTATLNGTGGAGGQGGQFAIDTLAAVDLVALNNKVGAQGFTGGFSVHTATGDLVLAAGQTLVSGSVNLTADGGFVTLPVQLIRPASTAAISISMGAAVSRSPTPHVSTPMRPAMPPTTRGRPRAAPSRWAPTSRHRRQTPTARSPVPAERSRFASGAVIDVSAKRPGDRLVPFVNNGVKYYNFVEGDQGGTVHAARAGCRQHRQCHGLRTPVPLSARPLSTSLASSVGIWRRSPTAASIPALRSPAIPSPLDVSAGLDTANSDGTLTTVAGLNFLGDKGDGTASTLVDFVQNFDISSSYGNLGGLATRSNFHAQPGMDLTYSGNITLASNWNLGAGVVDVDRAVADGVMAIDPALNRPYVVVGQEANLLANYTRFTYRVGGLVTGEPGVLSLRAGGNLDIKGSITDGFFQFRDQTDPAYLSQAGGGSSAVILTGDAGCQYTFVCASTDFATIADWNALDWTTTFDISSEPIFYMGLTSFDVGYSAASGAQVRSAPFSAIANSPAALGSFPMGTGAGTSSNPNGGDPVGSAEIFPLLPGNRVVGSWSYMLVAGADFAGSALTPSTNPQRISPSTKANLVIEGTNSYSYAGGGTVVVGGLAIDTNPAAPANFQILPTDQSLAFADWLSQFSTLYSGLSDDAASGFFFGTLNDGPAADLLSSWVGQFITANGLQLGQGTRNPVTGVYNGYSFGDYAGERGPTQSSICRSTG